ncbi:MAG TPA: hypothetical protein PK605_12110, partial [Ignavibacteria bacterium]|nr:hypothetical protein [Ignavibacteria bacterium]
DIELFLTLDEVKELAGRLWGLGDDPKGHHFHLVETEEDKIIKEITVAIVTDNNLEEFDERSREVLLNDK